MFWIYFGLMPALICAAAAFFTATRLFPRRLQARPAHPVLLALVAGAIWPFLVLGLTQLAIITVALPRALHARGPMRHSGVAADTTALAQR
jgi:hypothetical protein